MGEKGVIHYSQLEFAVEFSNGERVEGIKLIPSAVLAAERVYGKPIADLFREQSESWMYVAAHAFLQRREGETRAFDDWVDDIDLFQVKINDERPTPAPTRSPSGSSGPRSTKGKTSAG